eukprot:GHVS01010202.1.p1 GENE.GHVS01010202.1~~GHVS01010202.1.p1  ORF type:complete len:227 (+),score=40.08 GHVS01010202.1:80-760(+)
MLKAGGVLWRRPSQFSTHLNRSCHSMTNAPFPTKQQQCRSSHICLPALSSTNLLENSRYPTSSPFSCTRRFSSSGGGKCEVLFYTKSHEYVAVENAPTEGSPDFSDPSILLRIGITNFAVKQLGDVVYVELPDVGRKASKGESLITVESVKAVGEVYSPLDGTVVEVNSQLADDPAAITQDPEGEGWLIKMRPVAPEAPAPTPKTQGLDLMSKEDYVAKCLEEDAE